jgi:Flp pilus assembly pilin Flp
MNAGNIATILLPGGGFPKDLSFSLHSGRRGIRTVPAGIAPFVLQRECGRRYTHPPKDISEPSRCNMPLTLSRIWSNEDGQDIAEYAVMLAVILVLVIGTVRLVGGNANNVFSNVASSIQ